MRDYTQLHLYYDMNNESGALVPRAFPSKRQFVSERLNAFKLFTHRQTKRDYRLIIKIVHAYVVIVYVCIEYIYPQQCYHEISWNIEKTNKNKTEKSCREI